MRSESFDKDSSSAEENESDQNIRNFNLVAKVPSTKFECQHCSRVLSTKQSLIEHTYIHTGEKPYKCLEPGCDQVFRQSSQLSYHKRIHLELKKIIVEKEIETKEPTKTQEKIKECDFFLSQLGKNQKLPILPELKDIEQKTGDKPKFTFYSVSN